MNEFKRINTINIIVSIVDIFVPLYSLTPWGANSINPKTKIKSYFKSPIIKTFFFFFLFTGHILTNYYVSYFASNTVSPNLASIIETTGDKNKKREMV